MKQKIISKLKKELLVRDVIEGIEFYQKGEIVRIKIDGKFDNWEVLGSPDEIKEEDASELIPMYYDYEKTAVEYIIEALESEIYWDVNPLQSTPPTDDLTFYDSKKERKIVFEIWNQAESRTFNRNRTLIFVKN